jgi:hypothetical protein
MIIFKTSLNRKTSFNVLFNCKIEKILKMASYIQIIMYIPSAGMMQQKYWSILIGYYFNLFPPKFNEIKGQYPNVSVKML